MKSLLNKKIVFYSTLLTITLLSINIFAQKNKFDFETDRCLGFKEVDQSLECLGTFKSRRVEYWNPNFKLPLEDRISFADEEVMKYLTADNKVANYPERPFIPKKDLDDVLKLTKEAFNELPIQIKKIFSNYLGGIILLENFGGTGYSTTILGSNDRIVGGYIVLDPRKLDKTANEWNSWKENTPFKEGELKIDAILEKDSNNNKKNGIKYILLHELGHILNIVYNHLPPWEQRLLKEKDDQKSYPFLNLSWAKMNNQYFPRSDFINREKIVYYWGPPLDNNKIIELYDSLMKTSFPTLYASTNVWDDYAESFANYVHVVILKKNWSINILKNGKLIKKYNHCWNEER